mgnify:CR=1 FL=1
MSINEVRYLPECGSTNAYVKEHFEEFGPVAAVYTENQTAGRGRLGRSWVNAEGKALYYTVAIKEPLAQPATLPLLASLAVRRQLQLRYGVDCQIKWPNDLLLNGKKIVGILCESVCYGYQQQGRGILCGIGINLAQPQSYFDAMELPHGTSLALQGIAVDPAADAAALAETTRLTDRKIELDEDTRAELDRRQAVLLEQISEQPEITVTWFQPDGKKEGGRYITATGRLKKLDEAAQALVLTDGTSIPLEDVLELQSTCFRNILPDG